MPNSRTFSVHHWRLYPWLVDSSSHIRHSSSSLYSHCPTRGHYVRPREQNCRIFPPILGLGTATRDFPMHIGCLPGDKDKAVIWSLLSVQLRTAAGACSFPWFVDIFPGVSVYIYIKCTHKDIFLTHLTWRIFLGCFASVLVFEFAPVRTTPFVYNVNPKTWLLKRSPLVDWAQGNNAWIWHRLSKFDGM